MEPFGVMNAVGRGAVWCNEWGSFAAMHRFDGECLSKALFLYLQFIACFALVSSSITVQA